RRRSCGAMCSKPALSQQVLTTYQTTFCEIPLPHTFPILATARKILPSVTFAARVHWWRAALTPFGMGTGRMWPPSPTGPITAQSPGGHRVTRQSGAGIVVRAAKGVPNMWVNGVGVEMPRFRVNAIAHDHDA